MSRRMAVVTGAAEGIGWATAQRLAQDFDGVALLDLDGKAAGRRAAELGTAHVGMACDVADEASVSRAIQALLATGERIEVLVNNAGIGEQSAPTTEQDAAAFDRVLRVHLRGTFLMSQAVAPAMLAQGSGAIVNIASIAGQAGIPGRNAYGAAKAGIAAMTRSMACEWARRGVRVNAVAPGYVRTALVDRLVREGLVDAGRIDARTPMGRMARPEEIAHVIAFLASPQASYITGTTVNADGGWLALGAPEASLA